MIYINKSRSLLKRMSRTCSRTFSPSGPFVCSYQSGLIHGGFSLVSHIFVRPISRSSPPAISVRWSSVLCISAISLPTALFESPMRNMALADTVGESQNCVGGSRTELERYCISLYANTSWQPGLCCIATY